MTSRKKLLLVLLLSGSVALGVWFTIGRDPGTAPAPAVPPGIAADPLHKFKAVHTEQAGAYPANAPELQRQFTARQIGGEYHMRIKTRRGHVWQTLSVRGLESIAAPEAVPPEDYSPYGGYRKHSLGEATGFFRTANTGDRHWLVDPDGNAFLSAGVNTFRPASIDAQQEAVRETFGSEWGWAREASKQFRSWGFNTAGCWSHAELLRQSKAPVPHTIIRWPGWEPIAGPMTAFSIEIGYGSAAPGYRAYPGGIPPVFHPGFKDYVEKHATGLARYREDKWLIGYFLDNEIPTPGLFALMRLKEDHPAFLAAKEELNRWCASIGKEKESLTRADAPQWAAHCFETYLEIVTSAIRKHDPNHLILGPRLFGTSLSIPAVFAAVGRHCDTLCVHDYGRVYPDPVILRNWSEWGGNLPVLITEFYAKGTDTGFKNQSGVGFLVGSQHDRGLFYQNYVLSCLESEVCVGWHWHRYMDNDPQGREVMTSNRDENKGIVDIAFQPYRACVDRMSAINHRIYPLALSP